MRPLSLKKVTSLVRRKKHKSNEPVLPSWYRNQLQNDCERSKPLELTVVADNEQDGCSQQIFFRRCGNVPLFQDLQSVDKAVAASGRKPYDLALRVEFENGITEEYVGFC